MSTLKQVLKMFEDTSTPLSITQIARQVGVDPGTVEDMIGFWVRKGRLRDTSQCADTDCTACGSSGGCPFVVDMPTRYELVPRHES